MAWDISGAMKATREPLEDALDLIADLIVGDIVVRTPVDTGNLKSNTTWRKLRALARRIFNNTEYAIDVEFGTPPHKITPRTKKALAFKLAIEGGRMVKVVVRSVMHPGTPSQPFFRTGIQAARKTIRRFLR